MVELKLNYCSYKAAKYAVEHWHYSKSIPAPPRIMIGVWENNIFKGVVIFSRGASSNIGKPYSLNQSSICELTRVALKEHKTTVTKIIKIAIMLLKKRSPKIKLIVSYADSNQGHLGIIYQAGNWYYSGKTKQTKKYKDRKGNIWHSRQVSKKGWNIQFNKKRKCVKKSECIEITEMPKYRYLYPLNIETKMQLKSLPYPKQIMRQCCKESMPTFQDGGGGAIPTLTLQNNTIHRKESG